MREGGRPHITKARCLSVWTTDPRLKIIAVIILITLYTEAKVTQEIEQRAQWSALAWAACCALYSILFPVFKYEGEPGSKIPPSL